MDSKLPDYLCLKKVADLYYSNEIPESLASLKK